MMSHPKHNPYAKILREFLTLFLLLLGYTRFSFAEISIGKPDNPTAQVTLTAREQCPLCGIWTITNSAPIKLPNRKIRIDENSIYIDGCGEYLYSRLSENSTPKDKAFPSETTETRYELIAHDDTVFGACPKESNSHLLASIDHTQRANNAEILRIDMHFLDQEGKVLVAVAKKSTSTAFSPTVEDRSTPDLKEMDCPQCGSWTISWATHESYAAQDIRIDELKLEIPDCGDFFYEVTSYSMTPRQDGEHSRTYKLLLYLTASRTYQRDLCGGASGNKLKAELSISGHFQEGGTLEINLLREDETTPVLSAFGWNYDREYPGDSGSGFGSSAAMSISNAQTLRVLSSLLDSSLSQVNKPPKPNFDVHRFATSTLEFCRETNKNNGGGSWPFVWALSCQSERLVKKIDDFVAWQNCNRSTPKASRFCRFPTESFDRSKTDE